MFSKKKKKIKKLKKKKKFTFLICVHANCATDLSICKFFQKVWIFIPLESSAGIDNGYIQKTGCYFNVP